LMFPSSLNSAFSQYPWSYPDLPPADFPLSSSKSRGFSILIRRPFRYPLIPSASSPLRPPHLVFFRPSNAFFSLDKPCRTPAGFNLVLPHFRRFPCFQKGFSSAPTAFQIFCSYSSRVAPLFLPLPAGLSSALFFRRDPFLFLPARPIQEVLTYDRQCLSPPCSI